MDFQFVPAVTPPDQIDDPALWFVFREYHLLFETKDGRAEIPLIAYPMDIGLSLERQEYLGYIQEAGRRIHCFSGEIGKEQDVPPGMSLGNLRTLYPLLSERDFWLAGRAVQIVDWDRTHQFCGRCGSPTEGDRNERAKKCPRCGLTNYPRLAPAMIVRVTRNTGQGPQILLARAARFPTGMFSVLAGFVEPGETLESCVEREIQEEVGITVKNIRYFGSQPWPFPNSLMIAFTAEYDEGIIRTDPNELVEAGWFNVDTMPATPTPPSIANRLITSWLEAHNGQQNT